MSMKTKRRLDAAFKAKVALEALRNEAMVPELAARYQLRHRQLVTSSQLNLRQRRLIKAHCKPTLQISVQIWNFWVLAALCSAAVT
jgi:transposase-like protein